MTYSSLNRSSPDKIREWQRRSKGLGRSKSIDRGERVMPTSKLRAKPLEQGERARREDVRREIVRRDRGCVLAGVPGAGDCFGHLTPHHRRKASAQGGYTVENLACLCSSHNDRLESDADLARLGRERGLVVRAGDPEYLELGR